MSVVEFVGGSIGIPAFGDNQDVGSTTEWIWEDSDRSEIDVGVVSWGLLCRRTIEVPLRQVFDLEFARFWDFDESLEVGIVRI